MDEDIFDNILRTESVFKNHKSLNQAWVPEKDQKLLCRDDEIKRLLAIHRPIIDAKGEFSVNTLILGKGGIGKTLTARYFGRNFRRVALKHEVKITVEYYDCLQHRTKSSILRNISERLHYSAGHGYSDNEIMQQILKELKKRNESLLIILDEAHNLSSDDILALLNASIGFGEKNARFCIICVSRPSDWYKVDNEKISSRMQDKITMEPYPKEEAQRVLTYRKNLAFREGIIDDFVLELIADIVVENNNMRTGIDIMRACGIRADEKGLSNIDSDMILGSRNDINPTFRGDIVDQLKMHEKLTLWAIARTLNQTKNPFTKVEAAYENYQVLCEELETKAHVPMSFRKYIRNLADVKAIYKDYLNPTKDKKGRQLQIKLTDISAEKLIEFFEKSVPRPN